MKSKEEKKILKTIVALSIVAGVIEIIALFFFDILLGQQKVRMIIGITMISTAIIGLVLIGRLIKMKEDHLEL